MRNKTVKTRGAEVRVSRAKSRVVAKRKVALKAHGPKRVKDTSAQPDYGEDKDIPAQRSAGVKPAPEKRRSERSRETRKGQKREKNQRPSTKKREPDIAERFPAAAGRKRSKQSKRELARAEAKAAPHTRADGIGREASEAAETGGKRRASGPVRILFLGGLLVASLAALLWVYTFTGVLNVSKVEVRGNEVLGEDYLRSLSGITHDTHLLKMNVKAVESALLSEPYIAKVDVSRHYPSTVVLDVTERKPTGFVLQNGRYNLVDQEGMVLESVDAMPPGLVEIKDLDLQLLLPGEEISGMDFATVTSLLGSLPPALREVTTAVGMRDGDGLYLEGKGTLVIYGEASELSRKNTIALLALTSLVDRYGAVEYIDVSFPDHPVIKPVGSG